LIVCQLRLPDETIVAEWYLLSNVSADISAEQLAEWYYWRWRIESYFNRLRLKF
jgi:IS4 transposase